jgi:hypothetical protein
LACPIKHFYLSCQFLGRGAMRLSGGLSKLWIDFIQMIESSASLVPGPLSTAIANRLFSIDQLGAADVASGLRSVRPQGLCLLARNS